MTENEALEVGKSLYENITLKGNNIIPVAKYIEFVRMAIQALAKVQKVEAIGTVEEFKALKEKEERFDRNIKMFNEIGLEIRVKTIDEFVKAEDYLMNKIKEETADVNIDFEWRKVVCLDDIRRMLHQGLCEIAKQMKAGV